MENAECERLVTENIKLVYYFYESLAKNEITIRYKEDIVSEGMLGLVKAAKKYDATRGIKFATFAGQCIRNEMCMFLRKLNKQLPHEISLNTAIGADKDDNELCLADVLEDGDHNPEESISKTMLEEFLTKQQPIDKQILSAVFKGYKQREIADMVGMKQPTVSKRIRKIKGKFKI